MSALTAPHTAVYVAITLDIEFVKAGRFVNG